MPDCAPSANHNALPCALLAIGQQGVLLCAPYA